MRFSITIRNSSFLLSCINLFIYNSMMKLDKSDVIGQVMS